MTTVMDVKFDEDNHHYFRFKITNKRLFFKSSILDTKMPNMEYKYSDIQTISSWIVFWAQLQEPGRKVFLVEQE